jgi:hypothetical protein
VETDFADAASSPCCGSGCRCAAHPGCASDEALRVMGVSSESTQMKAKGRCAWRRHRLCGTPFPIRGSSKHPKSIAAVQHGPYIVLLHQADSLRLPLSLRARSTLRPFAVPSLARKPCLRLRTSRLGWNVRLVLACTTGLRGTQESKEVRVRARS